MSDIADRVKKLISGFAGVDPAKTGDATTLKDDLGLDSLHLIELAMDLEAEFGIEIEGVEAEAVNTVGDAVLLVERKISEQRSTGPAAAPGPDDTTGTDAS